MKKLILGAVAATAVIPGGCGGSSGGSSSTTVSTTVSTTSSASSGAASSPVGGGYSVSIDPANFVAAVDNPYLPFSRALGCTTEASRRTARRHRRTTRW